MRRVLVPYRDAKSISPYEQALRAAEIDPVMVEASRNLQLDGFSGLVLLGGGDVNPKLYGEPVHPKTEEPDDDRDNVECRLFEEALAQDLPVLGICRGLQLMNVALGGSLVQHLETPLNHATKSRSTPVHRVNVEPDSLLYQVTGARELNVNSRHHQAADRVGTGFKVSARATDDGVIEALELPGRRFVLAVQWHPEDQVFSDERQLQLFRGLSEALRA